MSLYIGNQKLGSIYLGSTKIKEAWVGNVKVYGPSDPYNPVTIGSQTWMSKNLAIDDGHGSIYTYTVNYGQGDVVEYYYKWDAAVRVAATVQGWHLPTAAEWETLANAVGGMSTAGTKLKSTYGWSKDGNGTDDYGFAAFPASQYPGTPSYLGRFATFWTATEKSPTSSFAYTCEFFYGASIGLDKGNKTSYAFSVRLVKD
jgi:uncharacterized protein (TIGR02145 family)